MKRPLTSTDLTDAEEAGLAGMEPLTSIPAELGVQGLPSGGQMCIGDVGLGGLSMPGQVSSFMRIPDLFIVAAQIWL